MFVSINDNDSEIMVSRCKFKNNYSLGGGALTVCNYSEGRSNVPVHVISCDFAKNHSGAGGAIYNWYSSIDIKKSTFTRNSAEGGAYRGSNYTYGGGAIYNNNGRSAISGSTFVDNNAPNANNYGGGAIYNAASSVDITDCTFKRNFTSAPLPYFTGITVDGKYLRVLASFKCAGGAIYSDRSDVTVNSSTFSGNNSTYRSGAIHQENDTSYAGTAVIKNCIFNNNTAGRPHYDDAASSRMDAGAVRLNGCKSAIVTNCTFDGNYAGRNRGAMGFYFVKSADITGCTFRNNYSEMYAGALDIETDLDDEGSYAFSGSACKTSVKDCTFDSNTTAARSGGGLYLYKVQANVSGCTFKNNKSGRHGAGIIVEDSSGSVANSTFTGNKSGRRGSAASIWCSDVDFVNCTFSGNTCERTENNMGAEESYAFSASDELSSGYTHTTTNLNLINCIFWNNKETFTTAATYYKRNSLMLLLTKQFICMTLKNCVAEAGSISGIRL
jgi:hypothetical protein